MSRLEDLIHQLDPNGVAFRAVGEITSKASKIKWANANDDEFRYIDLASVDRVTRRIGDTVVVNAKDAPSRAQQVLRTGDVIFATTRPMQMRWAVIPPEYNEQIASTGYCVLRPDTSVVLPNFLAHILGTDTFREYIEANQVPGNYPSIPDGRIRAYRIPVPPLQVQREIVRILDEFTALADSLATELKAERAARLLQYSSYRNSLMSFDDVDVEWSKLGEVASVRTGQPPPPGALTDIGSFPFVNAGTNASGKISESNTPGDTVTIPSRGQGGVGIAGYQASEFWCGPLCYRVRSTNSAVLNRFLFHYLKSIQSQIRGLQQTGGTPALNRKELVFVQVPVIPVETQTRIVRVLDQFETLVTDLASALPAEINVRRTQYAHYREKLLTFKELAS